MNLCIVVAARWTELSENLRYLALPAPDRGLSPVPVGVHLKGAGEAVLGPLFSSRGHEACSQMCSRRLVHMCH